MIYLYLARRDKKGIQLLCSFSGNLSNAVRCTDLKSLQINENLFDKIESIVVTNKMYWELWLEGANDYQSLKHSLRNRGYTNIPTNCIPSLLNTSQSTIKTSHIPTQQIMLKKKF